METNLGVRLGFVPFCRFELTPWCRKMRDETLAALARTVGYLGLEICRVPKENPPVTGGRRPWP